MLDFSYNHGNGHPSRAHVLQKGLKRITAIFEPRALVFNAPIG
jgi:hypothetical protein